MHAGTGHWTTARFCEVERKRLEADRVRAADNRRKHRELDRRERLLRDLEAVDKNTLAHAKRVTTLLRRRNRLVDALNAYVGTSQRVYFDVPGEV